MNQPLMQVDVFKRVNCCWLSHRFTSYFQKSLQIKLQLQQARDHVDKSKACWEFNIKHLVSVYSIMYKSDFLSNFNINQRKKFVF